MLRWSHGRARPCTFTLQSHTDGYASGPSIEELLWHVARGVARRHFRGRKPPASLKPREVQSISPTPLQSRHGLPRLPPEAKRDFDRAYWQKLGPAKIMA